MSGIYMSSWIVYLQDFIVPSRDFNPGQMMHSLEVKKRVFGGNGDGLVNRAALSKPDNLNFIPSTHMVEGYDTL